MEGFDFDYVDYNDVNPEMPPEVENVAINATTTSGKKPVDLNAVGSLTGNIFGGFASIVDAFKGNQAPQVTNVYGGPTPTNKANTDASGSNVLLIAGIVTGVVVLGAILWKVFSNKN